MRHNSLEEMEETFARVGPERIAAVFMEPVIGAGGVYPPAPGYIEGLAELCERTGVLLVIDAVICAFGRLGTWFGIERWGVEPDMIVFAKGVTSGYLPLGGVMISERIAEPFWGEPGGTDLPARLDLLRPPHVLRRRAREHRHPRARRPDRARARTGAGDVRCPRAAGRPRARVGGQGRRGHDGRRRADPRGLRPPAPRHRRAGVGRACGRGLHPPGRHLCRGVAAPDRPGRSTSR